MELEFRDDGNGYAELSNGSFRNCQFSELKIAPPLGATAAIRNTVFIDCVTSPGTCVIRSGVTLEHVLFSNLDCGDALRISSEVALREVVIKGRKPRSLIVRPESDRGFVTRTPDDCDYQLDVSEFDGEIEIVGLRGNMVRKDSDRQVTVRASWKEDVDWQKLAIGPFSYWRIVTTKLSLFEAAEGVFSLPKPSRKHYAETMREKKSLENLGLSFV